MSIFEIKECYFVSFITVSSCIRGYGSVFLKMRKIWDKHNDILLVLTIIALWATKKAHAECVHNAGGL